MATDNQQKPKFDIGDVVLDTTENKKWIVTFVYTPWVDNVLYNGVYQSMKFQFPGETFFYALRLKRGKKECIAPESLIVKFK